MDQGSLWKSIFVALILCAPAAIRTNAQTFSSLASFDVADGANPWYMTFVQGANGSLYGTTFNGGAFNDGAVFEITLSGKLAVLHSFNVTDGAFPWSGVVPATDGNFYGTTSAGGANNDGTVFRITPAGKLTTLHSFDVTDGYNPVGALIQGANGDLYGTTYAGGVNNDGTVFKITTAGQLTTLHSFDVTDGSSPTAVLVEAASGEFYGTTQAGGANNDGAVFKITPAGTLTVLHSFDVTDGANPGAAALIQATNGKLYGSTFYGGRLNDGVIFGIALAGQFNLLHSFDSADGYEAIGGLFQATNGSLFGTTAYGGTLNDGSVYGLSVGLGPFVRTLPTSGEAAAPVTILGNNLSGATSVTFNATPAPFTVVSATEITTAVPFGATSGTVQVVTPDGTLLSALPFEIK